MRLEEFLASLRSGITCSSCHVNHALDFDKIIPENASIAEYVQGLRKYTRITCACKRIICIGCRRKNASFKPENPHCIKESIVWCILLLCRLECIVFPEKLGAPGSKTTAKSAKHKSGIGYSSDQYSSSTFESGQAVKQDTQMTMILGVLTEKILKKFKDETIFSVLKLSCLFGNAEHSVIIQLLRNDLNDILNREELFSTIMTLLHLLTKNGTLSDTDEKYADRSLRVVWKDGAASKKRVSKSDTVQQIASLMSKLASQATTFKEMVSEETLSKRTQKLLQDIEKIHGIMVPLSGDVSTPLPVSKNRRLTSPSYTEKCRNLAFQYADFSSGPCFIHRYPPSSTTLPSSTMTRIARELSSLGSSIMVSDSTAAFARVHESDTRFMKILISGPSGTPYENGLFAFDLFLPDGYPAEPPKLIFLTTGNGRVRFNPNLYANGFVCLSLINTWNSPVASERWTSSSTILQLIVSIQAMIFVDYPYLNEPGYYNYRKDGPDSIRYNMKTRVATVEWAMIDVLKRPPFGFKDVVKMHFTMKREEILEQVERWKGEQSGDGRFETLASDLKAALQNIDE